MKLNLGCGSLLMPGFVNTDVALLEGVDIVHDLDAAPWPWPDASVSEIVANDIFEHVADPLTFMAECGRVLENGARLKLRVSYWKSRNAYTDPTHRRFCTENTFDYWCPATELGRKYGPAYARGVAFANERCFLDGQELVVELRRTR